MKDVAAADDLDEGELLPQEEEVEKDDLSEVEGDHDLNVVVQEEPWAMDQMDQFDEDANFGDNAHLEDDAQSEHGAELLLDNNCNDEDSWQLV
jgi:hypothetical protein